MRPALRAHLPRLIAPLLLVAAGLAHAQYSWIDEKGIRQLSDRPPPPGTPPEKILKAPGMPAAAAPVAAAKPSTQPDSAAPGAYPNEKRDPRPLAERQAEFSAFLHETAADSNEDKQMKRVLQRYCMQASKWKSWLETNSPASKTDEHGKSRPLTKEERASEVQRADSVLARCKEGDK